MKFLNYILLMFLSVVLLAGCRQTLYTNLSEGEANEMVLTLLNRGIDASKETAGKVGFKVTVEKEDFIKSLEIIKEHSLPKSKYQSMGQIFSGQGMISSQLEEQSRLSFALSQELSETFSRIDGVLDARVHVVLVHHDQASGKTTPPSAAVFIRHTKGSPVVDMVSGIKDTAARAIPGLTNDMVSVMLETYNENLIIPKKIESSWFHGVIGYVVFAIIMILLTLTAVGIFIRIKFKSFKLVAATEKNETKSDEKTQ